MLFLGIDWSEDHHDLVIVKEEGAVLAQSRIDDTVAGVGELHALVAEHLDADEEVAVGIETDHGLLVTSLLAAGYAVYAINPVVASRYRDRHSIAKAKSDAGDAKMLADLVRTDRHLFLPVAADTDAVEAIKVLARAHKRLIGDRQSQVNRLRSMLREYYPGVLVAFGTELVERDALAVLGIAPTPALGRQASVSKIAAALKRGGRQRNLNTKAEEIQKVLRAPQLQAPDTIAEAYGATTTALVAVIATFNTQIDALEKNLTAHFRKHPDAEIYRSHAGLGDILGARALAEFGDDPNRYEHAKSRKNYASTSPITRASGKLTGVHARHARNDRLADACRQWAFCSLSSSPGARIYYDTIRARGKTHEHALRQLANRWVGILHACLQNRTLYDENTAWHHWTDTHSETTQPQTQLAA